MQQTVICTHCNLKLAIPASAEGQRIQCPNCRAVFSVETLAPYADHGFDDAHASSLHHNSSLAWTCVCIVTIALAGGIGGLTWQLTHRPAAEETIAAADDTIPVSSPELNVPPPNASNEKKENGVPALPKKKTPDGDAKVPPSSVGEVIVELDASPKPQVQEIAKAEPAPPKIQLKESAKPPEIPSPAAEPPVPVDDPFETKPAPGKREPDPNAPKVKILDLDSFDTRGADGVGPMRGGPAPSGSAGKLLGRLSAHVGAVFDVEAKAALLLLPGGQAKLLDYPSFRPLGTYKLGGGTAYYSVYDRTKGRLYVLTPSAKAKDPSGKPGGSQLVCYDVRGLLDGRLKPHAELAPVKVIPLGGFCTNLCRAPDGAWLYALDANALKVARVNLSQEKVDQRVAVPPFTESIYAARDGKRLYAMAHTAARTAKGPLPKGVIGVLDAPSLTLAKTINLDGDPFALAATKEGILFVSGRGGVRSDITVVDVNKEPAVVATWRGVPPNARLKLSDDEKCLYLSKAGNVGFVAGLAIPETLAGSELPSAQWTQPTPAAARGEFLITPDHQFLLCDSGAVVLLMGGNLE